jgi:hypothetical protein
MNAPWNRRWCVLQPKSHLVSNNEGMPLRVTDIDIEIHALIFRRRGS